MTTRIGFTGSRTGMTPAQKESFKKLLCQLGDGSPIEFHHGGCKGSDVEAALIVRDMFPNAVIVRHPGRSANGDDSWEAEPDKDVDDLILEPKQHFARNRDIVDCADIVIATPSYDHVINGHTNGGTAYSYCYSIKKLRRTFLIKPNGDVEAAKEPS